MFRLLHTADRLDDQVKRGLCLSYKLNKIEHLTDHNFPCCSQHSCFTYSFYEQIDSLPQLYTFGEKND